MMPKKNNFDQHYNQSSEEHEYGDTIDTMHILHPLRIRSVWISLFYIKIFGNLT
jgi:hypothetical protein